LFPKSPPLCILPFPASASMGVANSKKDIGVAASKDHAVGSPEDNADCSTASESSGDSPTGSFTGDVFASIPNYAEIQRKVEAMKREWGYEEDGIVDGPDSKDRENSDYWVPRNPRMNRLTGIHPFNSEAPLAMLRSHGFLTPMTYHVIRNHGKVPRLTWEDHVIEINGLVDRPMKLSMAELVSKFPLTTLPVTINCAGNRRKEQNLIKKGMGFDWGAGAVSTHIWTGVLMRDLLQHVGIKSAEEGALWVDFFGPEGEVPNGDTVYGASHHRHVMLDPTRPVMLAFLNNGELLHPDHGFPVRLLIPGYIGGRMIKWLTKITVSKEESDTFYNKYDNRVFPPHIVSKDVATKESIWMNPLYRIDDRNLQCVCWNPDHSSKVSTADAADKHFRLEGYAYNGAGRPVHRIEVTLNGGRNWRMATIQRFEKPSEFGRCWCWVFWHLDVPVMDLASTSEICCRAWDDSQNHMQSLPTWNLMGMMNNPWFRIKVQRVPGEEAIWFEHPTRVEPTPSTYWTDAQAMHLVDGTVASPGWAERMHAEYSAAHAPREKDDDKPDASYAWEVEAAFKLRGVSTEKKIREARALETVTVSMLEANAANNWVAIHGLVYDCTAYLPEHPGGAAIIVPLNGKDASEEFEEAGHTMLSRKEVDRLVLKGVLEGFEAKIANLQKLGWLPEDGIPTTEQLAAAQALASGSAPRSAKQAAPVTRSDGRAVTLVDHTQKVKLTLAKRVQLSHNVVRYTFALPSAEHVLGLPIGQHVHLSTMMANPRTGGEKKYVSRAYTPVSNDADVGVVELVIKTYYKEQHPRFPDGGWLSQHLDAMQAGDTLDFKGPTGKIIYEGGGVFSIKGSQRKYKRVGCIAGGSGIAPCYQLMKYVQQQSEPLDVSLLFANVSTDDILLKEELDILSEKGMRVSYTVDKLRDGEEWNGHVGFISEQMVREALPPAADDTIVLVCGPPVMIERCVQPICDKLGHTLVEF